MAVVLVTGGSGTLGSHLTPLLRAAAHDVRVLSRRPGMGTHVGDLTTGAGVADAVDGAEVVVHAASDTRRLGRADMRQTQALLDASGGVRHMIYVSIVGIDQIPYAYYRRKLACEQQISASGVPATVVRATQFHELLGEVLRYLQRLPLAPLPARWKFQPIAAREVAARVARLVEGPVVLRVEDIGGPEVLDLGDMARVWREQCGRPRRVAALPFPGRVSRGFREGRNTCPDRGVGTETWAQWVERSLSPGR
ncbi:MAG: SDR family oxidoreductase [Acidimicrobiales bacterium]